VLGFFLCSLSLIELQCNIDKSNSYVSTALLVQAFTAKFQGIGLGKAKDQIIDENIVGFVVSIWNNNGK
jgi:hypothetical protein